MGRGTTGLIHFDDKIGVQNLFHQRVLWFESETQLASSVVSAMLHYSRASLLDLIHTNKLSILVVNIKTEIYS